MRSFLAVTLFFSVLCAAPLLQGTVLAEIGPNGATPDLLFLLTAASGLVGGPIAGAVCGALSGLLVGVLMGNLAVILACIYAIVGCCSGWVTWRGAASIVPASLTAMFLTVMLVGLELAILRDTDAPAVEWHRLAMQAILHAALIVPITALGARMLAERPPFETYT